ncbi:MAG: type 1 glutamine amidotransferase domain-containing protein [Cyanobacteria bacterium J06560_6]
MQFNLRSTIALFVCGLLLVFAAPSGALARAATKPVATTEVLTIGVKTLPIIFGTIAVGLIVTAAIVAILLPKILNAMGLHPDYDAGQKYDLQGKKALVVTTSHGVLSKPGETTGKPTGVFGSEMTVPYYEFLDAGMQVDLASIKGGEVPIDPNSFRYFIISDQDKRFLKDSAFQGKIKNSPSIDDIDFTDYDLIFFVGGWGPSYDFAQSKRLAERVSAAYYAGTPIMGSVCHGALAFVSAKDAAGKPLVAGRKMTGVTQGQLDFFGIKFTPKHPEAELKKAGADYRANHHLVADIFATVTVVDHEQRFVTGQNQNSGHETAQKMMELLSQRSAK